MILDHHPIDEVSLDLRNYNYNVVEEDLMFQGTFDIIINFDMNLSALENESDWEKAKTRSLEVEINFRIILNCLTWSFLVPI